ncbi:MAG: porin family protein [Bacteroidales bacterium]|nr:porin family protein [Bacteroidales bacterium]
MHSIRPTVIVLLLLMPMMSHAQRQKVKNDSWYDEKLLHVGFCVGFNTMDFKIVPSQNYFYSDSLFPEITSLKPGINIQIVTDYHPFPSIDLRFLPGVSFGQRNVVYYNNGSIYNDKQIVESSFLEFPLLVKYKGVRLNNVRPYIIGGLNYRYDLAGKKEYDEDKPVYIRLKRSDLYYEMGAGFDFYLTYFKLTVEARMSNGIRDILVHDPAPGYPQYVNAIEKMKSQIWVLSFYFE